MHPLTAGTVSYLRFQLRDRHNLIIAGTALGVPALWFGSPLLVATGMAPHVTHVRRGAPSR